MSNIVSANTNGAAAVAVVEKPGYTLPAVQSIKSKDGKKILRTVQQLGEEGLKFSDLRKHLREENSTLKGKELDAAVSKLMAEQRHTRNIAVTAALQQQLERGMVGDSVTVSKNGANIRLVMPKKIVVAQAVELPEGTTDEDAKAVQAEVAAFLAKRKAEREKHAASSATVNV